MVHKNISFWSSRVIIQFVILVRESRKEILIIFVADLHTKKPPAHL